MNEKLASLLLQYLKENNPDLLHLLEEMDSLPAWLQEKIKDVSHLIAETKPEYIIKAECMDEMTKELRPSKFLFVKNILEDEFPNDYQRLTDSGVLQFEVINMVNACMPVFHVLPLTEESEDDNELKYAVIGVVSDYLQSE